MDRIKPFCFLQGILDFDIVDKYISSRIMQYHGNQRNIVQEEESEGIQWCQMLLRDEGQGLK